MMRVGLYNPNALRMRRILIVLATVLSMGGAVAQSSPLVDGAIYIAAPDDGSALYVQVEIREDASAVLRVRSAADPAPDEPGLFLDTTGIPTWSDASVEIHATVDVRGLDLRETLVRPADGIAAAEPPDGMQQELLDLRLAATLAEGARTLDPFGSAVLEVRSAAGVAQEAPAGSAPWGGSAAATRKIELMAIGTMFASRQALADGTLSVVREAPFFYADPWRRLGLDLARTGVTGTGVVGAGRESLASGLEQRRDLPRGVSGFWYDRRTAHVMSLDRDLVSLLFLDETFTGGAHPNTWRSSATWVRDAGAWERADLCATLAHLGLPCDASRIRSFVVDELVAQEAAWVVEGEVHAATPWLLDAFTVSTWGLRFDYSPYQVGPYVQGPFVVVVPYDRIQRE